MNPRSEDDPQERRASARDQVQSFAKRIELMSQQQDHRGVKTPVMAYAAIYARVSTEDQGKGFSIPTQIEACQKFAEPEGYTVPDRYVIVDELSGASLERPGLQRLRELGFCRKFRF